MLSWITITCTGAVLRLAYAGRLVACNSNEYGQMFRKPSVNYGPFTLELHATSRPMYAGLYNLHMHYAGEALPF